MEKIKSFLLVNKSVRQTFAKNTFWLFVGEIVSRFFKMVLVVYAARILGVEGWGIFSYAISLATLFLIFSDLGLSNLITREVAKNSEEKLSYLSTAFFIKLILLLIGLIIIFIVTPQISKIPEIKDILLIVALILVFDSMRDFGIALNRALEKMELEAFIRVCTNFFISSFGLFVLFVYPSVQNLAYAYLAGSFIGLLLTMYILRHYFKNILKYFSRKLLIPIFNFAWPFIIFGTLGTIMSSTDVIMLGWLKTPTDIGLYSAAQRLIQFLYIVPSLLSFAIFPLFSKLTKNNENSRPVLERMLSLIFALELPIVLGGIILAKDIMVFAFGNQYISATLVFQIFLIMTLMAFPIIMLNNLIFAKDQQRQFVWYATYGATFNIILSFLLIPDYGIYGAAIATAISNFVVAICTWYKVKKDSYFEIFPNIKKIFLATAIMGLTTIVGKYFNINLILNICISAIIFTCSLYFLREPLLQELRKIFREEGA